VGVVVVSRPLGAAVAGWDAFLLDVFLRRADVDGFIARLSVTSVDPGRLVSFRACVEQIAAAASVASVTGGPSGSVLPDSGVDMISTREAGVMLEVTESRVRQMLRGGALDGRRVGRSWLVSRVSVEARLERAA